MQIPFSLGARQAITAAGQCATVTQRTIPLQLTMPTPWGSRQVPPISFAIMPGTDGVVLLGLATMRDLEVDPYAEFWRVTQEKLLASGQGVETPAFLGSRWVSLLVTAFQEAGGRGLEETDIWVLCIAVHD